MALWNIDAPGGKRDRVAVAEIQRRDGAAERKAAAQARRDARKAKRAGPNAILLYAWPATGICVDTPDGAYIQGPNGEGRYQLVVVGEPKGENDVYVAAVSRWCGLSLSAESVEWMLGANVGQARGFQSIILRRADGR